MSGRDTCPNCGSEVPAGAPCPRCRTGDGLDPGTRIELPGPEPGSLSAAIGPITRVRLPDTDVERTETLSPPPAPPEMPPAADRGGRLELFGEIGRGGMGAVLRGRDPSLGREVAVKVLLDKHRDNPDLVRRFVEEAQIGGQLQHPGVVPVYELGAFGDDRPYFAMKLVKGRTLSALLKARLSPADDRPRFLSVVVAVSQTVAYAHARGVIHRDLKPSNVMVGSFGEVQVMDWGLAKVLPRRGKTDVEAASEDDRQATVIATARDDSPSDRSRAGSGMGTPPYMAPEQARGEWDRVDPRCDVFALGSILCEVLTGAPAFTGRSRGEIQRKAERGDLADALARLDACGVEAELAALARDALAPEPDDRPRDAGAFTDRLTAYLAGVQDRLRTSELERARAEARAVEERKRRRVTLALAASVLALTTLGGLTSTYYVRQRQARAARAGLVLSEAALVLQQARDHADDPARWQAAGLAVQAAERPVDDLGDAGARRRLAALRDEVRAGTEAARRDRTLLSLLSDIRSSRQDLGVEGTDAAYASAFRDAGLDLDALPAEQAAARLRGRPPAVAAELTTFLDDWFGLRRGLKQPPARWRPLRAAVSAADPDPYREKVRTAVEPGDVAARLPALRALAEDERSATLSPAGALLLARGLSGAGDLSGAVALLRRAVTRHPSDVWVNFELAEHLDRLRPVPREEVVRYYTAARALRPETAHLLAHRLSDLGRGDEAEAVFRDLIDRQPGNARHLGCLGQLLKERGQAREAGAMLDRSIAAYREAIRLKPDLVEAHYNLGLVLARKGRVDDAIAAYREAIRLKPDLAEAHSDLGVALDHKGRVDDAIASFREAIRLSPDLARAHYNLGIALARKGRVDDAIAAYREAIRLKPDHAAAHCNLGSCLRDKGRRDDAIAAFREAIRLKPDLAEAHSNLGNALQAKGRFDGAIAAYREAIRINPGYAEAHWGLGSALGSTARLDDAITAFREAIRLKPGLAGAHSGLGRALSAKGRFDGAIAAYREAIRLGPEDADAHYNLGVTLADMGRVDGAIAAFREAIRLKPDHASAHYNLGVTLANMGRVDGAIAAYREAIRINPGYAEAHCNLGHALRDKGEFRESLAELRKGHELASRRPDWRYRSADWIRDAERLVALEARLPAVLRGDDRPAGAVERIEFARLCQTLKRHAAATRLFAEAFDDDPKLADDLGSGKRYDAACCAALAACGAGKDDPPPDEAGRASLRRQALDWLKADLDAQRRRPKEDRDEVRKTLAHWKVDTDLAGVRDPAGLAKLPGEEQAAWRTLWAEVDGLLGKS